LDDKYWLAINNGVVVINEQLSSYGLEVHLSDGMLHLHTSLHESLYCNYVGVHNQNE